MAKQWKNLSVLLNKTILHFIEFPYFIEIIGLLWRGFKAQRAKIEEFYAFLFASSSSIRRSNNIFGNSSYSEIVSSIYL